MWSGMPRISTRLSALRSTPFTTHRPPTLPLLRSSTAFPTPPARSTYVSRALHTTRPSYAKYERFDQRPSFGGSPGPRGGGPTLWEYVKRRMGGDRAVWIYGIGIGGGGIYYVTHLERVPETGRLRFMDVDEAQERELGRQTQLQTLSEYDRAVLPPNHPISKRIRKVATRIIESSGLGRVKSSGEMGAIEGTVPTWGGGVDMKDIFMGGGEGGKEVKEGKDTEWEVYVIDDKKTKNAFVLPGGKIFVFTGILPVSANDDGLATVLGHEIAHQVARHPAERMSSMKVLFALGLLLETLGLDVGVSRLLLTFMLQLPNSRKNESEADFIGLRLMSRACFDPTESSKMWQRMSASEGGKGLSVDFLSTHPANAKRIKQLENWMPEAQQIRAASPCGITSDNFNGFLDAVNPHGGSYGSRLW
ncbi:mitochondrial metalloendopeptidase OMA1 [Cryptococcus neoformans]|nr:mitochondrial metalloendopeptidase OMA1 [Cryptococcus neoformans var. grubii c45]OXB34740.1 mitochondrial metalloendopeptidase OMA1 [Cryptococcus neoformans var. grubii]OXC58865.1 mitochondrial metalloendopeptidase OMA1 [Cryptococcus neoformans var. grubii MW-RSA852]